MLFLASEFNPTSSNPFPTNIYRPIISLDQISLETIEAIPQYTTDNIAAAVGKDFLHARGKQALLDELRGILLNEFFICTNPFDTVALTNRAIDILDRYEGKLADDIQRFDTLGPLYPNIIIPDSDFNEFLSNYFAASFIK